jgi:hypothetical protein
MHVWCIHYTYSSFSKYCIDNFNVNNVYIYKDRHIYFVGINTYIIYLIYFTVNTVLLFLITVGVMLIDAITRDFRHRLVKQRTPLFLISDSQDNLGVQKVSAPSKNPSNCPIMSFAR